MGLVRLMGGWFGCGDFVSLRFDWWLLCCLLICVSVIGLLGLDSFA